METDALGMLFFLLLFLAALVGVFFLVKRKMKRGMGHLLVLLWLLLFVPPALGAIYLVPVVFARLMGWR